MERRLKERLIGASVLVMLFVILIPIILDDTSRTETRILQTNIPARPEDGFTSKIVPLPEPGEGHSRDSLVAPASPIVDKPAATAAAPENPEEALAKAPAADAKAKPAATRAEPTVVKKPAPTATAAPEQQGPAARLAVEAQTRPPEAAAVTHPDRVGLAAWIVQLGSFSSEQNANALSQRLRQEGYAAFVEPTGEGGEKAYRVRVGPELLKSEAQTLSDRLKTNMHLEGIVLSYP